MPQRKSAGFNRSRNAPAARADLEALRVFRDYLIFKAKNRGLAYDRLKLAIDHYAEELTGDRTALHASPASTGR
jgi:hypothetical protein